MLCSCLPGSTHADSLSNLQHRCSQHSPLMVCADRSCLLRVLLLLLSYEHRLDHSAIYSLIAATYTPFVVLPISRVAGELDSRQLLCRIWLGALCGVGKVRLGRSACAFRRTACWTAGSCAHTACSFWLGALCGKVRLGRRVVQSVIPHVGQQAAAVHYLAGSTVRRWQGTAGQHAVAARTAWQQDLCSI
jgi:hypothetical protein